MAVSLSLTAALLLGLAAAFQQRAAAGAPDHAPLSPHLIVSLLRTPMWAMGMVAMLLGYAAQAAALGKGRLLVVEPLLAVSVVIALVVSARLGRHHLRSRDVLAALLAAAGIVGFVAVAQPSGGSSEAPLSRWLLAVAGVGTVAALCVCLAIWRGGISGSVGFAIGGGLAFALADALTKSVLNAAGDDGSGVLRSWELYSVIGVGALGFWLVQNAYHSGHIGSTFPAVSVLEPLGGSLLGILVLREHARSDPFSLGCEVACAVLALVGVFELARSPLLRGIGLRPL